MYGLYSFKISKTWELILSSNVYELREKISFISFKVLFVNRRPITLLFFSDVLIKSQSYFLLQFKISPKEYVCCVLVMAKYLNKRNKQFSSLYSSPIPISTM